MKLRYKIALLVGTPLGALILAQFLMPRPFDGGRRSTMSAIGSLRTLDRMEQEYRQTYPGLGFACSLTALGGASTSGIPNAEAAQLIPEDLASGQKAGYVFTFVGCDTTIVAGKKVVTGYRLTAVPIPEFLGRHYGFCMNQGGTIFYDPEGGTNCTKQVY